MDPKFRRLIFKTAVFILSLSMAWYLLKSPVLQFKFISEFIAGMLYASFLTSPISLAMIAVLSKGSNPVAVALVAGFGAVFSDLLMVSFFRQNSGDLDFISRQLHFNKINKYLIKWKIEFLIPAIGAFIVASPLPDELGLMMLGASKLKYYQLVILTYLLNTAGILLIVIPVNLIS